MIREAKTRLARLGVWMCLLQALLAAPGNLAAQTPAGLRGGLTSTEKLTDEEVEALVARFLETEGDDDVRIARRVAIAYLDAGRFDMAYYYLNYCLSHTPDPESVQDVRDALLDITPDVEGPFVRVEISTPASGAKLCGIDGKQGCYKPPFVWYRRPGPFRAVLHAPGHQPQDVMLNLLPGSPAFAQPGLIPLPEPELPTRSNWPWVLGATGVGVAALGLALELVAWDRNSELDSEAHQRSLLAGLSKDEAERRLRSNYEGDVQPLDTAGVVLLAAGGAAVLGAVVWYFLEPDPQSLVPVLAPLAIDGELGLLFQISL